MGKINVYENVYLYIFKRRGIIFNLVDPNFKNKNLKIYTLYKGGSERIYGKYNESDVINKLKDCYRTIYIISKKPIKEISELNYGIPKDKNKFVSMFVNFDNNIYNISIYPNPNKITNYSFTGLDRFNITSGSSEKIISKIIKWKNGKYQPIYNLAWLKNFYRKPDYIYYYISSFNCLPTKSIIDEDDLEIKKKIYRNETMKNCGFTLEGNIPPLNIDEYQPFTLSIERILIPHKYERICKFKRKLMDDPLFDKVKDLLTLDGNELEFEYYELANLGQVFTNSESIELSKRLIISAL
jgi:hypothetical protein